jgi:hypothetical protein
VSYFEINKVEQLPAQMNEIFDTVQSSLGEKVANMLYAIAAGLGGIIYAVAIGPIFALVCLAYLPVLLGILGVFGSMAKSAGLDKLKGIK